MDRTVTGGRRWKIALAVVLVVALLVGGGLCAVAQPISDVALVEPAQRADPARLEQTVRRLVDLSPRTSQDVEQLDAIAKYIERELISSGGRVSTQPFTLDGTTYRNVIAGYGALGGERIIIGAHYDAAGPNPGADDNASGVAGLLELAQLFAQEQPKARVDLVAYTLEERSHFGETLRGSAEHAKSIERGGDVVRAMFSLEMIGFYSDQPGTQRFPAPGLGLVYPTTGNFITVVGQIGDGGLARKIKRAMRGASALPVYSINAPAGLRGVDFSDHRNFWIRGMPAVMITDTAFYRNANYHQPTDLPETLDYVRMGQVVDGVRAAVRALEE